MLSPGALSSFGEGIEDLLKGTNARDQTLSDQIAIHHIDGRDRIDWNSKHSWSYPGDMDQCRQTSIMKEPERLEIGDTSREGISNSLNALCAHWRGSRNYFRSCIIRKKLT